MSERAASNPAAGAGAHLGGRLLVATPAIEEPTFARTVVLLLDHDEDGALGVVLNRASEVAVRSILPGWEAVVSSPDVVFVGGPVAQDSALGVVAVRPGTQPIGVRPVAGGLALVDLDTPTPVVADALARMRVYAGYAGWGPGQLEGELGEGSWYVVAAERDDAFCAEPGALWRAVLRRQPAPLSWVATYPADPALN
jgi:putative transcriptional regulator